MTENEEKFSFGEAEISFIVEAVDMKETVIHNINETLLSKYEFLTSVITKEIKKIESTELIITWSEVNIINNALFFLGTLAPASGSYLNMDITNNMEQMISNLGRKIYFAIPFVELINFKTEEDYVKFAVSLISKNQAPAENISDNEFDLTKLSEEQISSLRSSIECINSQSDKPRLC